MSLSKENRVCIASISGAHGVRGDVKLRVYLDNPADISQYFPLLFEDGSEFPVTKVIRSLPSSVIVSVKNIHDRDAVLKLRGENLYVARDQLPLLEDNTYYHTDLIGLSVQNEHGKMVGKVKYVHDHGAGPILEIFDPATYKSALVPFQDAAVPFIDVKSHLVVLEQYLTDLYE